MKNDQMEKAQLNFVVSMEMNWHVENIVTKKECFFAYSMQAAIRGNIPSCTQISF